MMLVYMMLAYMLHHDTIKTRYRRFSDDQFFLFTTFHVISEILCLIFTAPTENINLLIEFFRLNSIESIESTEFVKDYF